LSHAAKNELLRSFEFRKNVLVCKRYGSRLAVRLGVEHDRPHTRPNEALRKKFLRKDRWARGTLELGEPIENRCAKHSISKAFRSTSQLDDLFNFFPDPRGTRVEGRLHYVEIFGGLFH
jgi:hypothetical protein